MTDSSRVHCGGCCLYSDPPHVLSRSAWENNRVCVTQSIGNSSILACQQTFHAQITEGLFIWPISPELFAVLLVDTLLLFDSVGNVWGGCQIKEGKCTVPAFPS